MDKLEIEFNVRGSRPILFKEGSMTGDMTEYGIGIDTVWWNDKERFGGCIDRKEATQLRDFLNKCIEKWDNELCDS